MLEPKNNDELPAIPGKRYFTIGEVSDLCGVKPHVLRYWEQEFPQLKPGPMTLLRGALPKVNGAGSANADVSNQRSGVR